MTKKPTPSAAAPAQSAAQPSDQSPALSPEQQAQLDDIEREVSEADAAVREAAGWTRDDARLVQKLTNIGAQFADLSTEAVVQSWTDHEAFTVEQFVDEVRHGHQSEDGEMFDTDGAPLDLPAILADWEIHFSPNPEATAQTFDAEQVQAAGDGIDMDKATAAIDAAFADQDRPAVAARIRELEVLVSAPRLYKSAQGYSSNYGAPYIAPEVIDAWIAAGLAEDIPSAGNEGGVRMTQEARTMLADLKREQVAS